MSCNCNKENNTKQLEILAQGTYADRLLKTIHICFIILSIVTIISLSITLIYITGRISNFLDNNKIEIVDKSITDSNSLTGINNSNVIINTESDNNTIGDK